MFTSIAAFLAGVFVSPIVIIVSIGSERIIRIGKRTLAEAENKPRTPERDAAIADLKEKLAKLESSLNRPTDRHED